MCEAGSGLRPRCPGPAWDTTAEPKRKRRRVRRERVYYFGMPGKTPTKRTYKVIFSSHGQVYEIFARKVMQAELMGFVQIEDLVFGQRSSVVVDPSEEKLKIEFQGVKRIFLPIYSIARIDEVEKEGPPRIHSQTDGDAKVTFFPSPILPPGAPPKKQ